VVVEESVRGAGYGTALCDELEAQAAADGIDALYLLTTTAAGFFEARGYEAIDRNEAPPLIRQTTEFEDLCPASATCMKKSLRSTP
jgi:amino-acid N-acetyltransferase